MMNIFLKHFVYHYLNLILLVLLSNSPVFPSNIFMFLSATKLARLCILQHTLYNRQIFIKYCLFCIFFFQFDVILTKSNNQKLELLLGRTTRETPKKRRRNHVSRIFWSDNQPLIRFVSLIKLKETNEYKQFRWIKHIPFRRTNPKWMLMIQEIMGSNP